MFSHDLNLNVTDVPVLFHDVSSDDLHTDTEIKLQTLIKIDFILDFSVSLMGL